MRIQRDATPILHFYLLDMLKWMVKVAVRHPERRMLLIAIGRAALSRRI